MVGYTRMIDYFFFQQRKLPPDYRAGWATALHASDQLSKQRWESAYAFAHFATI